ATSGLHPIVEYYRWYTNQLGNDPGNDWWRTSISGDGGATWTVVENSEASIESWLRVVFFISDFVTPAATMRMKFVAQDSAAGSLVEAAVDDFRLLSYPTTLAVGDGSSGAPLALAPPAPNPAAWRTSLRFTLPSRQRATLRIYDVSGRAMRTLAEGTLEAGPHALDWNGRDDAGRRVAAGPYFVRLIAAGRGEMMRKVTIVR